mmetsp:Transcript_55208/g.126884  ORF Transcript_55208/g.126884 Transcript_55208/m.126884 type:complete len:94 (-) Transcript_55208:20-301(-)
MICLSESPSDKDGKGAMHYAALMGRSSMLKILATHGLNVDARDRWQNSPLHTAAGKGHKEAVATLRELGADREARNIGGKTYMDVASHQNVEL